MYASSLHPFFSSFSQPLERAVLRCIIWIIECQLDCNALRNPQIFNCFCKLHAWTSLSLPYWSAVLVLLVVILDNIYKFRVFYSFNLIAFGGDLRGRDIRSFGRWFELTHAKYVIGAHQSGFAYRSERRTWPYRVLNELRPFIVVSCIVQKIQKSTILQNLSISISFHHSYPYFTDNEYKMKKFNPILKVRRAYTVNIALRANSRQWLANDRQILLSTERAWKKRELSEARGGYRITCPRGIRGWTESNPGGFPTTLTPSASVYRYHACTWTRTYNSHYLSLNSFSSRLFVLQSSVDIARISFFLFSLYNAQTCKYFFSTYLQILLFTLKSDI